MELQNKILKIQFNEMNSPVKTYFYLVMKDPGVKTPQEADACIYLLCVPAGMMNRGMGMPERSPMGPAGDWGMPRSTGSPSIMRPAVESYNSKGMMGGGPMVNRSNSVPGTRSMLQQQLMDMGTTV